LAQVQVNPAIIHKLSTCNFHYQPSKCALSFSLPLWALLSRWQLQTNLRNQQSRH
jgi:hypothetical protein